MTHRIRFLAPASEELLAAAEWYEDRLVGLGIEFIAEVDTAIGEIAERPLAWPRWRPDRPYRRRVLRRFPYIIFFRVLDDSVEVTAVAHAKQRPGYWLDRIST